MHLGFSLSANLTYTCVVNIGVHVACWQLCKRMRGNFTDCARNYAYAFSLQLCRKLCWHDVRVPTPFTSLPSPPPQVKTELTLTAMTTNGKLLAEKAIEGVKERGHTNLSGGLLAALEVLYRYILPHVPALSSP